MRVEFGNVEAQVVFHDVDEESWLDHFLSYPEKVFVRGRHRKDRRVPLYRPDRQVFPAGLLAMVRAGCAQAGHVFEQVDKRGPGLAWDTHADVAWLRDYQRAALVAMVEGQRGIIAHGTGSGKTELFVAAARLLPWHCHAIVVDAVSLLHQTADRFVERGDPRPGIIGDSEWTPQRVTVASVDTLAAGVKRGDRTVLEFLQSIDVVHVDEAHGAASPSHTSVLAHMVKAYCRWGYSGTPFGRTDAKSLVIVGNLGPLLHRVRAAALADAGTLARPRVRFLKCTHEPQGRGAWRAQYDRAVVFNDTRNSVLLAAIEAAVKPVLVLVTSVDHGRNLDKALGRRGVSSEFVSGQDETHFRQATVKRIAHGDTDVVVATTVFRTGLDIPEVRTVVNAAGGKSTIAIVQGTGRGMRRHDKHGREIKAFVDVVDVDDVGGPGWLSRHSRGRRRAYQSEQYEVL